MQTLGRFALRYFKKCQHDEISIISGNLAFVTLLSFVPFVTVIMNVMSTFGIFEQAQSSIESYLLHHFVPEASAEVQKHLIQFIGNLDSATGLSTAALFVIAVMLLKNIDKELNRIFITHKTRPFWQDLLIYIMVIILGPVLIGISLLATSAFLAIEWIQQVADWFPGNMLNAGIPLVFSFLYFLLLYRLVPAKPPSSQVAMVGASVTAVLFELCKYIFSWYISAFPTYQIIYGSLAAIPIFCVWVYFNWLLVLLGAEFTCVLDEFKNSAKTND